jgi:hypothetical protein
MPADKIFDRVVVLSALIPKSYYLISSSYNTFQLQEGVSIVTVTIPPGNYTFNAFKTVIPTLLTTASPNHWTYTMTSPNTSTTADTGLFTYVVSGNTSQPAFIFSSANSLWENFGFPTAGTYTFSNGSLISQSVAKLQVEDRLYIVSDIVDGQPNMNGVLQEINAAPSPNYSTIVYQCTAPEHYSKKIGSILKSEYTFALVDEHNFPIDLNGLSYSFTLLFYKEDDWKSRLKNFMKLLTVKASI